MDLYMIHKYAYWGAISHLEILEKLHDMCLEVNDGDAVEEYEIQIEKTKSDLEYLEKVIGEVTL